MLKLNNFSVVVVLSSRLLTYKTWSEEQTRLLLFKMNLIQIKET